MHDPDGDRCHIYHGMSDAEYRGMDAFNASMAKTIIGKSPAHAYQQLHGADSPTDEMIKGSLLHAMVFDRLGEIAVVKANAWNTKVAKAAKAEALEAGKIPLLEKKWDGLRATADAILKRFEEFGIALPAGKNEVVLCWVDKGHDGAEVLCKAKLDHLNLRAALIADLKTTKDASPRAIVRYVENLGLDIQDTAYRRALIANKPKLAGREKFLFLFCETKKPFACTPVYLSGEARMLGQAKWEQALSIVAECRRTRKWPAYTTEPIPIDPPPWALAAVDFLHGDDDDE